jgi:hypothetical protein
MSKYPIQPESTKFDFLTPEELSSLIEEYYSKTSSMKVLKEKYNLPSNQGFEKYFPWIKSDVVCDNCATDMIIIPHHRDWRKNDPECPSCGHDNTMNCRCHDCLRIAREAFLAQFRLKKELIHKTLLEAEKVKVPFEKLTSEERISLAILIGDRSSNDLSHIIPFGSNRIWNDYKGFILPLFENKIISIHPESDISDFDTKENKFGKLKMTVNYSNVKWNINVSKEDLNNKELYCYFANAIDNLDFSDMDMLIYWKKIATEESLKNLQYSFENILDTPFETNMSILKLLDYLTDHFSIAQITNIIWRHTNNTLRFIKERRVTTDHLYNYFLKSMRTTGENAIKNNIPIHPFEIPKHISSNSFSEFFFDSILKVGKQGYRITPQEIMEMYATDESIEAKEFKTIGDYIKNMKFSSVDDVEDDTFEDDNPF